MQVKFSRSGGFVPISIGCHLDTNTMAPDEAHTLKKLVESSGVMTAKDARVKAACDVHHYHIEVIDGQNKHQVTFDHLSRPDEIKPLIDFLLTHSKSLLLDD
jgi:hypothetical protein